VTIKPTSSEPVEDSDSMLLVLASSQPVLNGFPGVRRQYPFPSCFHIDIISCSELN
jgi:hypothetical protein